MLKSIFSLLLFIVICCFFTSLLRNSSFVSSEMSEEQIELIVKFNGNEEEEVHDYDMSSYFKTNAALNLYQKIDYLWSVNRFLEKNYIEPHLETQYSPPEIQV